MCYKPITLKTGSVVPCNRCPKCIARRTSAWSFRLMQEERQSSSAHFITLTYDTRFVPINNTGLLDLQKRDLQLFFKRLRKSQSDNRTSNIKYYAVGEYGGETQRPHYHAIIFNAQLELIQPAWPLGNIFNGEKGVTGASVGYTLKYMCKNKKQQKWWLAGRQKEFGVMSKGLGVSYLNKENADWHLADPEKRMYCNLTDGKKISMPRYYKDKLYYEQERANIRDACEIIANEKMLDKIKNMTVKSVWNEQQAIDAAFDKMYHSSYKTTV